MLLSVAACVAGVIIVIVVDGEYAWGGVALPLLGCLWISGALVAGYRWRRALPGVSAPYWKWVLMSWREHRRLSRAYQAVRRRQQWHGDAATGAAASQTAP